MWACNLYQFALNLIRIEMEILIVIELRVINICEVEIPVGNHGIPPT